MASRPTARICDRASPRPYVSEFVMRCRSSLLCWGWLEMSYLRRCVAGSPVLWLSVLVVGVR